MKKELKLWLDSLKETAIPDMDECLLMLGDIFPLLKQYKNTIQDPIWHAEGDVHIHTDMVLKELYKILNSAEKPYFLGSSNRQILILSALLHDIAKPICTKIVDSRVKASGHEAKGKDYLTYKLLELDLPLNSYLQIMNLVGYHQRPKLSVIKNLPRYDYLKLNNLYSFYLMYCLEIADMRGRTCQDLDEQLMYLDEYLKLSTEYSKENFEDMRFNSNLNHYDYNVGKYLKNNNEIYSLSEASAKLYEHSNNHAHAIIMCGVSGSGKSTYIKSNFPDYKVISMDEIRAELCGNRRDQSKNSEVAQLAKERFKQALRAKEKVVWDATNTRKEFREQLIQTAHNYHALTELHVLLSKESTIRKQNKDREFDVPDEVITKQMNQFQFPDVNETHIVKYIIRD